MPTTAKKFQNLVCILFRPSNESRRVRKNRRLLLEELSPRHLMASLDDIISNFNYGMQSLRVSSSYIGSNAFSDDIFSNLPIVGERDFDNALNAGKEIRKLFAGTISDSSSVDAAISSLVRHGFVVQKFNTEPDAQGDFIRLSHQVTTSPGKGLSLAVEDLEGIDYFGHGAGEYNGTLTGTTRGFSGSLIIGLDEKGF